MALVFDSTEDVKAVLGAAFYEIFGITDPGLLEVANASGVVKIDGKVAGQGPGPYELPPGRHEVLANDRTQSVRVAPAKKKSINAADGG